MSQADPSLSISNPHPDKTDAIQKAGLALAGLGLLTFFLAWGNVPIPKALGLAVALGGIIIGTTIYSWRLYKNEPEGIKNNGVMFKSLTSRGVIGWTVGVILTAFYVLLYWFPEYLGYKESGANEGFVALFDPLSQFFKGKPASQWFMYGTLYTLAILSLGIKFLLKYRGNSYQIKRTLVVIAAQLFLAYLIPEILAGLNYNDATNAQGEYLGYYDTDIKNTWPLDYDYFYDWHLDSPPEGPRRLSLTLQLSDKTEYEGGDLEFKEYTLNAEAYEKGSITMFDSYHEHRISPVEKGVRHSLVGWFR